MWVVFLAGGLFCTKGGCNKWGQRSAEHGSRSIPRTGQIRMKTRGNNGAWLETEDPGCCLKLASPLAYLQ